MHKKSPLNSASVSPRPLVVIIVCAAACLFLTRSLPAFLRSEAPANLSQRTLTFAERVAYQHAIEDVYWRHRIWPRNRGERPDPKPSLDAVMSQAQLEKKVADYLRKSQALEDYWQRSITAEQLQAEMDRMAKHTRQPEMLSELFEALGNDPLVIAECLARPMLAERLLRLWYAYDQRMHGELKQRAQAELAAHPSLDQMKHLSGKYSEVELIRSDRSGDQPRFRGENRIELTAREWDDTVLMLAAKFNEAGAQLSPDRDRPPRGPLVSERSAVALYRTLLPGKLSSLQEDETCYYATVVVTKSQDDVKLAIVVWPKKPLESWLTQKADSGDNIGTASRYYALPLISGGACIDDSWTVTGGSPDGRFGHTAVWTGNEMIVWGGIRGSQRLFNTGSRYDPITDNWTPTSGSNAPTARAYHTAVWTGTEMIVWGGNDGSQSNTGARYNPDSDDWTAISVAGAPSARSLHTAVLAGNKMIVWGGYGATELNTGGKYDPNTDSWSTTSTANAPTPRYSHKAVSNGSEMIVWGGENNNEGLNTGGKYNPVTNSWTATSMSNAPAARYGHTSVWTGTEMIVWGGYNVDTQQYLNTGARYNPTTNSWLATNTTNAPEGRSDHTALWTGSEMIIWGGSFFDLGNYYLNSGGKYNPASNIWTATTTASAPVARDSHTAVWTGTEMIVWGGFGGGYLNTGGRYNPITGSWLPTGDTPSARAFHAAVWTGSEMIIWSGISPSGDPYPNTGAKYDPSTDAWLSISNTNTPTGRQLPTAVWTGTEMIVWGGSSYDGTAHYWNTGGRYNPIADSWSATTVTNAPVGREYHTAVWTGSEMVIWGGSYADPLPHGLNTGGRYNPTVNSWTDTTTTDAPSPRNSHTAVWTGSEMIIWDGLFDQSGGKYNPTTDTWITTSTTNAPSGRAAHTAVWTGNEMIIWGGYFFDGVSHYFDTGGRYDPDTNSWTATSTTNAPSSRDLHTALWNGSGMIVWGGQAGSSNYFNTGGRYDPGTDSWLATSTLYAPDGRYHHTAVWSGSEMIVWGGISIGYTGSGGRYCAQAGPTPTPTPTATGSPSGTPTATATPTETPSATPRVTPTPRSHPTPRQRPTSPPHVTPVPPPSSPLPTPAPRP